MKIDKLELKHVQHYPFGSLEYRVGNIDFLSDIYADMFSGGIAFPEAIDLKEPKAIELINSNVKITQPVFSIEKNIDTGLEEDVLLGSGEIMGYDIDDVFLSEVKPVLYSLSQLTEEIEHGCDRMTPIKKIIEIAEGFVSDDDIYHTWWHQYINNYSLYSYRAHTEINEFLLEHHFDLYNLIPNKLAIEKK